MTTLRHMLASLAQDPTIPVRDRRELVARILKEAGAGDIAERLAAYITQIRLDNPYGGNASKQGRSWDIGFSKPGVVDGTVRVFGPRFIQVKYQTRIRALPPRDSRVFLSEWDAKVFLELAFVDGKYDAALALKTK